ncbi:unnamed protein product [Phytophthora lilii]|uniref:Unnamed protein product n=1 Tax=Phytophthora lilii TaxID=2077276 RepID=A0A9W6U1S7_9STRA|nr:unnamed protein product [Phytophthora lilii]
MTDSTQLSDAYLLDSSLKSEPEIRISKGKKVITVNDGNNGSYNSGLVTIDSSNQLNGSNGWASLKEGYLSFPYVVTAKNTGTQTFSAPVNRFCSTLQTGIWNLVSDLEVELDGKSILTSCDYKMFWNNLRAQTETSLGDMYKHGAETNLYPDDWYSINYTKIAAVSGDGYSNNQSDINEQLDATLGQNQESRACNSGFVAKLNNAPMVVDTTTNDSFSWPSLRKGASASVVQHTDRSAFIEKGTALAQDIAGIWIHMVKIRLTDLHPIFKDLDLCANPKLKLKLRFNTGTVELDIKRDDISGNLTTGTATLGTNPNTSTAIAGVTPPVVQTTMKISSVSVPNGNVVPIMVASGADKQPMSRVASLNAGCKISFSFGPLRNAFTELSDIGQYIPYSIVRLHVPFYDLHDPRSIVSKPVKTIKYLDCNASYFRGEAGKGNDDKQLNATFDRTLGATYKNIKYVAVLPFAETTDLFATVTNVEQFQSPFDSAPWTYMPGASMRNFQVTVGNTTVFAKTHEYDYESFLEEFSKLGAINGDVTREMNTGLIDFNKWTFAQRAMIADCSRITEKDVPASVRVSFTNNCSQGMNVLVLVVYERELSIDRLTGEVERWDLIIKRKK